MSAESYCVRVAKGEHVFSAAHFITMAGDLCERLHGHNYRVAAELAGPLDDNYYVVDFLALRDLLGQITRELDHHVLLPTESELIRVTTEGEEVVTSFGQRRWVFPSDDCRLLPIANTTAELLAAYIGRQLLALLHRRLVIMPERLKIELDECDGQLAIWQWVA